MVAPQRASASASDVSGSWTTVAATCSVSGGVGEKTMTRLGLGEQRDVERQLAAAGDGHGERLRAAAGGDPALAPLGLREHAP